MGIRWEQIGMTTSNGQKWEERYRGGNAPWGTGKADFNLIQMITGRPVPPCKALEIGCGTGSNALWLARQGFQVTALDASERAIEKAREKASAGNVECEFLVRDFLTEETPGAAFEFLFDRGCLHAVQNAEERIQFAERAACSPADDGLWLTLIGSADGPPRKIGPPQLTGVEVLTAVELSFEVLQLSISHFDSDSPNPPQIRVCLMKKRNLVHEPEISRG